MAVPESINFDRLTKNARKKLGKRECGGELKFHSAMDSTRETILEGVARSDCQIAWISYEKSRLHSTLLADKHKIYLNACEIVLPELFRQVLAQRLHIMMDKYYPKKWECDRLDEHVKTLLEGHHAGNFIPKAQVSQFDSLLCKELQVHDFVVGAIFQQIERDVGKYIKIIEDKIVFGRKLP